ncbi:hypothetical protein ABZ782_16485 [Streptomyces asoensis]
MDPSALLPGNFVGRVLHEFEKLTIAVPALGDTALAIGMLGHETGVDGVRLQDPRGLFENGLDYRRGRRQHCYCAPGVSKVRAKNRTTGRPPISSAGPFVVALGVISTVPS